MEGIVVFCGKKREQIRKREGRTEAGRGRGGRQHTCVVDSAGVAVSVTVRVNVGGLLVGDFLLLRFPATFALTDTRSSATSPSPSPFSSTLVATFFACFCLGGSGLALLRVFLVVDIVVVVAFDDFVIFVFVAAVDVVVVVVSFFCLRAACIACSSNFSKSIRSLASLSFSRERSLQ